MELRKPTWNERANETQRFHKLKVVADKNWTIKKTASILDRSYGSVAEDLLLASWMETHPRVANFKNAYEAIKWIRNTKYSIKTRL